MKKLLAFAALFAVVALTSCKYDDDDLWNSVHGLENRVAKLEELCKQMNTNIASLQTIVTALQNNVYVTGTTPLMKDGKEIGYTITFSKGNPITIYHGKDGQDGEDGTTPTISVKKDTDGVYYWTLNGEFIMVDGDAEGGIGKEHFFSSEKLTTLLAVFKYKGEFQNAVEAMKAIYEVGGKGHSCGIYSFNDEHINRLALAAPVSRMMVRQPQNKANAGANTNGMPATSSMGCGTWGGNIVSENICLKHYMNTTWVARPINMDMPSNECLFGKFYDPEMDE